MNAVRLEAGKDTYTLAELYRKAAETQGLGIRPGTIGISGTIGRYTLDRYALEFLEKRGIRRDKRKDSFVLVDENPQDKPAQFAPDNTWDFLPDKKRPLGFDLTVELCAKFMLNASRTGISMFPRVAANLKSATDLKPNLRFFAAMVELDPEKLDPRASEIARKMASSRDPITISWEEIGLDGIREVRELFSEFLRQHGYFRVRNPGRFFSPPLDSRDGHELFISSEKQPAVFDDWREKLKDPGGA